MTEEKMLDKLREEIIRAKTNKLYGSLYNELEADFTNISEIPFLRPHHLEERNWKSLSVDSGPRCVYFTSGTTSEPKAIYFGRESIEFTADYIAWFCKVENIAGNEKVVVLLDQSFWGSGYFTSLGHVKAGNTVIPIDADLPRETIQNIIELIKPSVISSTPSVLLELKKELRCPSLKIIETTGEIFDAATRAEIESFFHVEVFDAYGLTEGVVGVECTRHDGYHFQLDKLYLEIIDPESDKQMELGQRGELVMTVLWNAPFPIIRYRTGDICSISNQACECGLAFPRIWIHGRKEKYITLYESSEIPEKALEGLIYEYCNGIVKYETSVKVDGSSATLLIDIKGVCVDKMELRSRIINFNYDMRYLSKRDKLRIIINDHA